MEHMYECINCIELKKFLQAEKKKVTQKNKLITLLRELVKSYEAKDLNLTFNDLSRIHESSASEVTILKQRLSLYLNENQELLQLKNETATRNDFLEKKYRDIEDELSHLRFVNKQLSDYYREKEAEHDQYKDRLKKLAKKLLAYEPKNLEARKVLNLQNTPVESDQKVPKSGNKKKSDEELKGMKRDCFVSDESGIALSKFSDSLKSEELGTSIISDDQDFEMEINNFLNLEECPVSPTLTSVEEICVNDDVIDISETNNNALLVRPDTSDDEVNLEQTVENVNEKVPILNVEDRACKVVDPVNESPSKKNSDRSNIGVISGKNITFVEDHVENSSSTNASAEINYGLKDFNEKNMVDVGYRESSDILEYENSLPDIISPLKSDESIIMGSFLGCKENLSSHETLVCESPVQINETIDDLNENIVNNKNDRVAADIKNECCSNSSEQTNKSKKPSCQTNSSKYKHLNDMFFNGKPINEHCSPFTESYSNSYPQYMGCCGNVIDPKPPIILKLYNCSNVEISIPSSSQRQELPVITVKNKLSGEKEPVQEPNFVNKQLNDTSCLRKANNQLHRSLIFNNQSGLKESFNESNHSGQKNINKSCTPVYREDSRNSSYYFSDYLSKNKDIINRKSFNEQSFAEDETVKCERLFAIEPCKEFDVEQFCSRFKNLSMDSSIEISPMISFSHKTGGSCEKNDSMFSILNPPIFHYTLKSALSTKNKANEWIFGQNCNMKNSCNVTRSSGNNNIKLKPSKLDNNRIDATQKQSAILKNIEFMKTKHSLNLNKNIEVLDSSRCISNRNLQVFSTKEVCENRAMKRSSKFDEQSERICIPSKVTVSENNGMAQSWYQMRTPLDKDKLIEENVNLKPTRNLPSLSDSSFLKPSLLNDDLNNSKSTNPFTNVRDIANKNKILRSDKMCMPTNVSVRMPVDYCNLKNVRSTSFSPLQEHSLPESLTSKALHLTQLQQKDRDEVTPALISESQSKLEEGRLRQLPKYFNSPKPQEPGKGITKTKLDHEKNIPYEVPVTISSNYCIQKRLVQSDILPQKETSLPECQNYFPSETVESPVPKKDLYKSLKKDVLESASLAVEDKSLPKSTKCSLSHEPNLPQRPDKEFSKSIFDLVREEGVSPNSQNHILRKNSPEKINLPKTDKFSALDAKQPSIPEKVIGDKKPVTQDCLLPKKKLLFEHAVQQKESANGKLRTTTKTPSPLKNSSKTSEEIHKKPDIKVISDLQLNDNKFKNKINVTKDLKINLKNKKKVDINDVANLKSSKDHLATTDFNTVSHESSSLKKKSKPSPNSKQIFHQKPKIAQISPEIVSDTTEELYMSHELEEIFKEVQHIALLSPLRRSPDLTVEEETNRNCEEPVSVIISPKVEVDLKNNASLVKSKDVILSEIHEEKVLYAVDELIVKKSEANKENLLNDTSYSEEKYEKCTENKTESNDFNKCDIFLAANEVINGFKTATKDLSQISNKNKDDNQEIKTSMAYSDIKTYVRNKNKVSPVHHLTEVEKLFTSKSLVNEKSQDLVDGSVNSHDFDIYTDPVAFTPVLENNENEMCPDFHKDDKNEANSPIQESKNQDSTDLNSCPKPIISLGFYLNRDDLEKTDQVNSEEINVDSINELNIDTELADFSEAVSSINSPTDIIDDKEGHQEDLTFEKEDIGTNKRKSPISDDETEENCHKKQKILFDDDTISCESDVFICALKYLSSVAVESSNESDSSSQKTCTEPSLTTKIAINHIKNLICGTIKSAGDDLYDNINNTVKEIEKVNEVSALNLAKAIIEILSETNDKEEIKTKPFIPSMTKTVKYCLLIAVSYIGYNRDFVMQFLDAFEQFISSFYDKSMTVKEGTQLVLLYTAFSRSYNLDYKVKCLIYDVLYTRNVKAYPMVYKIIQTWPDILPSSQSCTNKECLLTETIIFILLTGAGAVEEKFTHSNIGNLRNFLQKYFGYKPTDIRRDDLADKIIARIANKGCSLALVLLCKCESWEWACTVVEKKLFPILQSIKSSQMEEYILCEYILTLGRIVRGFPITKAAYIVKNTLELFSNILHQSDSTHLSEIIIESISLLRRHNLMLCTSILMKWKPITKQVTKRTIYHIKSIIRVKNVRHWRYVYSTSSVDIHHNTRNFRNRRKF